MYTVDKKGSKPGLSASSLLLLYIYATSIAKQNLKTLHLGELQ